MGAFRISIGATVHRVWRHIDRRRRQNTLRRPGRSIDPIAGIGLSDRRCCSGARSLHTIGNEPFAAYTFLSVNPMQESPEHAINRYLRSGEHDPHFRAWPGDSYLGRVQLGDAALRAALKSAIQQRTRHLAPPAALVELDVVTVTRRNVLPMVQGLFSRNEQACILDMLGRSVVFLTPATIDKVLEDSQWLSTAWDLANLFLAGVKAELLADDAPNLVGLSEETTCYLSTNYFDALGRFDDFLVHEVAHIFHNCKRRTIGLRETRQKEWLLEIDYTKRETFAYACETYSRIHKLSNGPRARQTLLFEYARGPMPSDDRVDVAEYLDILGEAVAARNGWKRILARCSPPRKA